MKKVNIKYKRVVPSQAGDQSVAQRTATNKGVIVIKTFYGTVHSVTNHFTDT